MAVEDGAPAEVAEMLMKADRESITRKDERGHLPLHVALVYGQTNDMVRTLLKANPAACAVPAERGSFPLHLVLNPHFPVTVVKEILKEHPKAVFEANNEGLTPLHLACTRGSVECVELILKANPAAAAMYARNRGLPLHVAASAGALGRLDPKSASEICQALVHAFPDAATRVDEEGRLPIHLAAESETGKEVIETLYIAFPGGIHHVDAGGRSPADRVPRADKIRLLIEGMDPQDVKREREKREAAARRAKKPMYAAAATGAGAAAKKRKGKGGKDGDDASGKEAAERYLSGADALSLVARVCQGASSDLVSDDLASLKRSLLRYADVVDDELRRVLLTPVPVRPRRRGERRSLRRTFPGASLRPGSLAHDPDTPRRLSTPLLTPLNSTSISSLVRTLDPQFYPPTVLVGVTHEMRIMREEVFGPVLAIVKIHSDDEAVALANDCDFGLGSNVFGSRKRALRVGAKLNAGMTTVNDFCATYMAQSLPFGGVKESGFDRFAGVEGLRGCCHVKSVVVDGVPGIRTDIPRPLQARSIHWFPYDPVGVVHADP